MISSAYSKLKNALGLLLIAVSCIQLNTYFFPEYSFVNGVRIDYLAPAIYATQLLAMALIVLVRPKVRLQRNLLIFAAAALLNIFFAQTRQVAVYKWISFILLIGVAASFRQIKLNAKTLLQVLAVSAGVQLVLVLLQLQAGHSLQGVWYYLGERMYRSNQPGVAAASLGGSLFVRPYGTFSHPNSLGGFYALLYTFTYFYSPFKKFFGLRLIVLSVCAMLVVASFSKAAIGAVFVALIIHYAINPQKSSCWLCTLSKLTTFGVLAGIVFLTQGDAASVQKRLDLMENAITIITAHPLWGTGFGNYLYAQAEFPHNYSYFFLQPVHNIFLLFFAETGVLGAVFGYIGYRVIKMLPKNPALLYVALIVAVTGMVDHYWLTLQQNMLLAAMLFGVLTQPYKTVKKSDG